MERYCETKLEPVSVKIVFIKNDPNPHLPRYLEKYEINRNNTLTPKNNV